MMQNDLSLRFRCLGRLQMLLLGLCCALGIEMRSQSLQLVDMTMPDTLYMGENYEVLFAIHNDADTNVLGNLQLWFENYSNDSIATPLGGFNNTLQYFAPGQIRQFVIPIEVTPSFFIEGGNTVVIWPSMVGDPRPEELEEMIIYVLDPNGTTGLPQTKSTKPYLINPASTQLQLLSPPTSPVLVDLLDFSGRKVLSAVFDDQGSIALSGVRPGLYVAVIRSQSSAAVVHQRLILQ